MPILMPRTSRSGVAMNVAEILAHKGSDVTTIGPDRSVREAIGLMAERSIGAVVVTDAHGTVIGMFSERDVVRHVVRDDVDLNVAVSTVMTPARTTCTRSDRIETLAALMTERRIRHLPVLDDDRLCGIVSIGDVVKERVSQLQAEHDQLVDYVRTGR